MGGIPLFPEQATAYAGRVDLLFFFMIALSLFFIVLIIAGVLTFSVRYRRKHPNEIPPQTAAHSRIEVAGMGVLLVLAMFTFGWGTWLYVDQATAPDQTLDIYVIGKKWMWKYQYPDGQGTINDLYIPVGQAVRLTMTSQDVIHSYFVPAFRVKQDVVPGRYTSLWFQPTKPGRYHLFCAEYCGTNHSRMLGWVYVLEPDDYQTWLSGEGLVLPGGQQSEGASGGETPQNSPADQGEELFGQLGCAGCHNAAGNGPGPSLVGIYGQPVQLDSGETVVADDSYIRNSILNPNEQIVEGYQPIMPTYEGQVSEEQILQLLSYIQSLGTEGASNGADNQGGTSGAPTGTGSDGGPATTP